MVVSKLDEEGLRRIAERTGRLRGPRSSRSDWRRSWPASGRWSARSLATVRFAEEFDERYRPLVWAAPLLLLLLNSPCSTAAAIRCWRVSISSARRPHAPDPLRAGCGGMASAVLRRGRPVRFLRPSPGILCLKGIPGTSLSQRSSPLQGVLPDVVRVGPCAAADVAGTRSQAAAGTCSQASAGTGCIRTDVAGAPHRLSACILPVCPSARLARLPVCPSVCPHSACLPLCPGRTTVPCTAWATCRRCV